MNILKLVIVSIFLFASGSLLAGQEPKLTVCHVSELGVIDLLVVSASSSHLGNASHSFDGLTDYEPSTIGASGESAEDIDGDGIDEGCEPPEVCPCWEKDELEAVTAENQNLGASCDLVSLLPFIARIENISGSTPDVEGSFTAADFPGIGTFCQTRDFEPFFILISPEEAASCIAHIVEQCDEIGSPIPPPPPPAEE